MNELKVNDVVPNFTLKDQDGNDVSLSDFKGKKVLVSFHPFAFTSVCADQMRALERNYKKFQDANIEVLGISIDPQPTKKAWASVLNIDNMRILSDFHPLAKVAKDFGVFAQDLNSSGRANFLIDEDGKLEWKKVYELSQLPDIHELLEFTNTK